MFYKPNQTLGDISNEHARWISGRSVEESNRRIVEAHNKKTEEIRKANIEALENKQTTITHTSERFVQINYGTDTTPLIHDTTWTCSNPCTWTRLILFLSVLSVILGGVLLDISPIFVSLIVIGGAGISVLSIMWLIGFYD